MLNRDVSGDSKDSTKWKKVGQHVIYLLNEH